jgi:tetratricopeptide (TPR) repeat protein
MRFTVKPALAGIVALLVLLAAGGCAPAPGARMDEQREPHFLQGKNRLQALDYAGAIESFERAVEVNPRSAAAHFELGLLYEQRANDPATAVHHYNRFLRLRPDSPLADTVRQRILLCKQTLASEVALGPVTQPIQQEIEKLSAENNRLRQRVSELEEILARRPSTNQLSTAANHQPPPRTPLAPHTAPAPAPPPPNPPSTSPGPGSPPPLAPAARTYQVQSGDTLYAIARRHGVTVDALKAANPGLTERNLPVGRTLKLPAR